MQVPFAGLSRTGYLVVAAIAGVLALCLAIIAPSALRLQFYQHSAVIWAVLSILLLLLSSFTVLRCELTGVGRRGLRLDLWVAAIGTGLVLLLVPARSLIEADESTMLMTAELIRWTGNVLSTASGVIDAHGVLHPVQVYFDKRGVLFPTLMVPLHAIGITGIYAAWTLNAVGLMLMLLFAARIVRRYLPDPYPSVAVCLLLSFPIVGLMSRLGTYDTLNAGLLVALVHLSLSALRAPHAYRYLHVTALAALVTQLRYESILPATLVIGALMVSGLSSRGAGLPRIGLALLPLSLVPGLWRMAVPISMELPNADARAWSMGNVADNVVGLLDWTLGFGGWQSGQLIVGYLALFGALILVCRRQLPRLDVALLIGPVVVMLMLLMPSFWGSATYSLTTRYYLFFCVALACIACAALARVPVRKSVVVAFSGAVGLLGIDQARRSEYFVFPLANSRELVLEVIDDHYQGCNVVVLSPFPVMFLRNGVSSMHPWIWHQLDPHFRGYLEQMGAVAVVAPLVESGYFRNFGEPEDPILEAAPVVAEARAAHLSISVRELWRASEPLSECKPRLAIRGVDRHDRDAAMHGL